MIEQHEPHSNPGGGGVKLRCYILIIKSVNEQVSDFFICEVNNYLAKSWQVQAVFWTR